MVSASTGRKYLLLALEPTWRSRFLIPRDDGPISSLPRAQTTNVLAPRVLTHCGTRHGRIGRPERSPQDFMTRCNCQARHGISWAPQLLHTTRLWLTSALDGYPTLAFFCMRPCYAFRSAGMHRSRRYFVRSPGHFARLTTVCFACRGLSATAAISIRGTSRRSASIGPRDHRFRPVCTHAHVTGFVPSIAASAAVKRTWSFGHCEYDTSHATVVHRDYTGPSA